jgi:integrase
MSTRVDLPAPDGPTTPMLSPARMVSVMLCSDGRAENGPIAANRARVYLAGAFSWVLRQGMVDSNPVMGTEPPSEERRRDRVLSAEELASVWQAAGAVGDEFGAIIRLLMLTGQRRDEVAAMAWSEIDLERALWTLPAVRTKNCREHEVPLSRHAVALLPPRREGRALVFGQGKGGFSPRCCFRMILIRWRRCRRW